MARPRPNGKPPTATEEERERQRDEDAARAREIAEEQAEQLAVRGSESLALVEDVRNSILAKTVRDWVRSVLVPPAILRLHDIGHGLTRHEVATMTGTVMVPPSVNAQVKALAVIVGVGMPAQVGLVDDDGNAMPGIFALGPLDLDEARREAHGDRYLGEGSATVSDLPPRSTGGFEMVEVEEGAGHERYGSDQAPPPVTPGPETTEQKILRKRRERKAAAANGHNGNGRRDG